MCWKMECRLQATAIRYERGLSAVSLAILADFVSFNTVIGVQIVWKYMTRLILNKLTWFFFCMCDVLLFTAGLCCKSTHFHSYLTWMGFYDGGDGEPVCIPMDHPLATGIQTKMYRQQQPNQIIFAEPFKWMVYVAQIIAPFPVHIVKWLKRKVCRKCRVWRMGLHRRVCECMSVCRCNINLYACSFSVTSESLLALFSEILVRRSRHWNFSLYHSMSAACVGIRRYPHQTNGAYSKVSLAL